MKLLFTTIFLSFIITAISQKSIKLTWGPFYKEVDDNKQVFYLGYPKEDSTHLLFINNAQDLVEYNYNLEQVKVQSFKRELKNGNIVGIYKKGNYNYVISVNTKGDHFIQKFNPRDYTLEEAKIIFTSKLGESLKIKYSPDSSKVLFYRMIPDGSKNRMEFVVLTETLRYRWQKVIEMKSALEYFHEPVISNAGDVYYCDTDGDNLLVYGLTKGGDDFFEKKIPFKSKSYIDPVLLVNREHLFVVQGHKKDNIQYDCVTDLDIFEFDTEGTIVNVCNYKFKECKKNIQVTHLHVIENGDILIISELLSTRESNSSNMVQYGSMHVMRFNLEVDSILWEREIFKNHYYVTAPDKMASQYTPEYKELHDHKMYEYKGELIFLYNDNCSNCMTNSIGQKIKSHSNLKNSCLNMVSINADGKVTRNTYSGRLNVKFFVMMNNMVRISENRVIVWAKNEMFRLGRLYLD